jgi:hypothetical protein
LQRVLGQPSFIVVEFPPQHIAELAVLEGEAPPQAPYPAVISGPSRLAFAVPDAVSEINYTLGSILDLLRQLTPLETQALPDGSQGSGIEFPYRLVLAGEPAHRWFHRLDPSGTSPNGRVELWHTRLGTVRGDGTVDGSGFPRLAAVSNLSTAALPWITALHVGGRAVDAMSDADCRQSILVHSQAGGTLVAEQFMLTSLGAFVRLRSDWPPETTTQGLASWGHTATLGRDQYVRTVTWGYLFPFGHRASMTTITRREFDQTLGIAHLVQSEWLTVLQLEINYQDFWQSTPGYSSNGREMPLRWMRIASNIEQKVSESTQYPVVSFDVIAEDFIRSQIRFNATMLFVPATFSFDDARANYIGKYPAEFAGQLVAIAMDDENRRDTQLNVVTMRFDAQRLFGPGPGQPPFLPTMQNADVSIPAVSHFLGSTGGAKSGQRLGAARALSSPSGRPRPLAKSGYRHASSVARSGEQIDPSVVTIEHFPAYKSHGFPEGDKRQVFARLLPTSLLPPLSIPAERAGGFVAPTFQPPDGISRVMGPVCHVEDYAAGRPIEAERLLGDVKLFGTIALTGVPISGIRTNIVEDWDGTDDVDPDAAGTLFHDIDNSTQVARIPVFNTRLVPDSSAPTGIETRFIWKPRAVKPIPIPILAPLDGEDIELVFKGRMISQFGSDNTTFEINGKVANFQLDFAELIKVSFNQVTFNAGSNRKMDINPSVKGITFLGPLSFVNVLQNILGPGGFGHAPAVSHLEAGSPVDSTSDGAPQIETQADGAVLRYDLGIPSFGIGVFSLQNIELVSSLSIPFVNDKPTTIRFALSERAHPFVVTVGIFGGGGFFALEMRTGDSQGLALVEASVEFGANVAFDIGVASGGVYLLAGFYYSMDPGCHLSGYLRCGGYLEVLQLVSVSVEFEMMLEYSGNILQGCAVLTIAVRVLFFSTSIQVSVHKEIANFGSAPTGPDRRSALADSPPPRAPTFGDVVSCAQWKQYCQAFA